MQRFFLRSALILLVLTAAGRTEAQDNRLRDLEERVTRLEKTQASAPGFFDSLGIYLASGGEALATGVFCALWARSTGRDPWLWLAAGVVFNFFALLAVWSKHEEDKKKVVKVPEPLL